MKIGILSFELFSANNSSPYLDVMSLLLGGILKSNGIDFEYIKAHHPAIDITSEDTYCLSTQIMNLTSYTESYQHFSRIFGDILIANQQQVIDQMVQCTHIISSIRTDNVCHLIKLMEQAKVQQPSLVTIAGGLFVSYFNFEHPALDIIYRGPNLLRILDFITNPCTLPVRISEMDDYSFDTSKFTQHIYTEKIDNINSWFPIFIGMGCRANCDFCFTPFRNGTKEYFVPPTLVAQRIHEGYHKYGIKKYFGSAPSFNDNTEYLKQFYTALENLGLSRNLVDIYVFFRVRKMDPIVMENLVASGVTHYFFGLESWSPRLRKMMNKHFTNQDAEQLIDLLISLGATLCLSFIVGYPNEQPEDIELTRQFVEKYRRLPKVNFNFNPFSWNPHAPMYDEKLAEQYKPNNEALSLFRQLVQT